MATVNEMKKCTKCEKKYQFSFFRIRKQNLDGYSNQCKECVKAYEKSRYLTNTDAYLARALQYRAVNKSECADRRRKNYEANRQREVLRRKEWRFKNKELANSYGQNWKSENKNSVLIAAKVYRKENKEKIREASKKWKSENKSAMQPSKAIVCRATGKSDFIGHGEAVTMSPDPKQPVLVDCMKCVACGWSVSGGVA